MVFVLANAGIEAIDRDIGIYQIVYQLARGLQFCVGFGADLDLGTIGRDSPKLIYSEIITGKCHFHHICTSFFILMGGYAHLLGTRQIYAIDSDM